MVRLSVWVVHFQDSRYIFSAEYTHCIYTTMSLDLVIGSMYSGKSTELFRRVRTMSSIGMHVIVINSAIDNRYDDANVCATHYGDKIHAVKISKLLNLTSRFIVNAANGNPLPDVVAIDEAQFFDDLYDAVKILVDQLHLSVIVGGLVGDYNRNHFGEIHRLLPLADDVKMCRAYCYLCRDQTRASFTKRIRGGQKQIEVGSCDQYIAVCRRCYLKE